MQIYTFGVCKLNLLYGNILWRHNIPVIIIPYGNLFKFQRDIVSQKEGTPIAVENTQFDFQRFTLWQLTNTVNWRERERWSHTPKPRNSNFWFD